MARRRRSRRNALHEGLMGAVLGGLNFQMAEHTRKQMEEAELRKEQRLAAAEAARAERDHQFQLTRDAKQNEFLVGREEAGREHALGVLGQTQEFTASENAANRAVTREGHASAASNARLAAERDPRYQTFADESGRIHRVPMNPEGDAAIQSLQDEGRKLRLMESSAGGRMAGYSEPEQQPPVAGIPGPAGAGSGGSAPQVSYRFIPGKGLVAVDAQGNPVK